MQPNDVESNLQLQLFFEIVQSKILPRSNSRESGNLRALQGNVSESVERRQSTAFQSKRFTFNPALSGLRGAASFGVVLFHATIFIPYPWNAITNTFYLGVPIFLMMSIFLLLHRLDVNRDLKHYFKRRIIRVWPIYYGCLIAFFLIFRFPFWDFVRYLFFVEYYVNPFGYFPVSIFWTLQLEEAMYLFIPIIHKFGKRAKQTLASALIVGGFGYFSILSTTPLGVNPTVFFQLLLPVSLIAYGFGILAYAGNISGRFRWFSIVGIAGYATLYLLNMRSIELGYYQNFFVTNVLLYSVALVGFAAIVSHPPGFLGLLAFFGEESYALYAIHYAFVMIFGLVGVVYSVALAFLIEYAMRPKEIARRLLFSYGKL